MAPKGTKMKTVILTSLMWIWASYATAHSPLESTSPAHAEILTAAPNEIVLNFKGDIRLTRVVMTHTSHNTDLDLDGFKGFLSEYTIRMPSMGAGPYQIEWRGLGEDGHPMIGTFSFMVEE